MVGDGYAPVAVIYGTPCREPAIGDLRAQFLRHSFLAWVLLPLSVCAWESWAPEQWRATCAQGYSLMSLLPLCVVELHYLYSEQCAWTSMKSLLSEPELVVLKHFGVLRHRKWLVLLGLFEVFILFTDVMFPFIARACDGILTEHWQTAWRSVPLVGPRMAELLNTIRFWGYALLATGAVILTNGVLGLVLCIPCAHEGEVTGDDFVAWARAAETSMMPSVASLAEEMAIQKRHLVDYKSPHHGQGEPGEGEVFGKLDGDAAIMFELFNQKLAAHIHFTESAHFLLLMLGKVLIGRCFQLWIQSSFLALAFHQERAGAKDKVILGCCLGATLLVQRAIHSMRTLGCTGLPLLLAIILCVVWSGVKIALAFVCEDHLWNLTTGCVKLSHP